MSVEIAWKQNILVTDSYLLKLLLVVFGFGLQAFVCDFSRQNICSVLLEFHLIINFPSIRIWNLACNFITIDGVYFNGNWVRSGETNNPSGLKIN